MSAKEKMDIMRKMNFKRTSLDILVLSCFLFMWPLSTSYGESLQSRDFPYLITSLNIEEPLDFCGERVPLEYQDIRERMEKELLLSLWDRPQIILWLKRSHRHLPYVEKVLKENGLPDDLKFVAIAESALLPHARSSKGAIGFWQFTTDTGRRYNLRINRHFDDRRNIFSSTRAALGYLKDLYEEFGFWTLAVAAFNMGENGLRAEIIEQGQKDYYQLYLPLETQRYIFRILAVKLIFSDPKKYGFELSGKDYYPPIASEKIQVTCFHEIPIRIIAQSANTHFKMIKDLNPEIRGYYLPVGTYNILVPKGGSEGFLDRYQHHVQKFLETQRESVYVVKEGDNLSSIAEKFHIPLQSLLIWNHLDLGRPIHPGDRLIIYPAKKKNPSRPFL
jgi:hypothetical protein